MPIEELPDLLIIGVIFLIGWTAHIVGAKTHIPRVSLLLATGIFMGPAVFNIVPPSVNDYFSAVTHLALAMIGFLLGESFVGRDIIINRKQVLFISIGASLIPAFVVFILLLIVSHDLMLALMLAGISTATDPAASLDVIREVKAKGPLSQMVKRVVAVDDAWGVIIFSLLLVIASLIAGNGDQLSDIFHGLWDVVGALLLGIAVGIPMSKVIGRYQLGEPTIVEAMGFVFTCGGIALYLDVSYLLACMMLGATVAKLAKHVNRPFHAIEKASDPFLVIFFILSGMSLTPSSLNAVGIMGGTYIIARCIGKIIGANICAKLAHTPKQITQNLGQCLLPQAGIAIGMALLVNEKFPDIGEQVLTLTIATTVFFEVIAPVVTRWHLVRAGETATRN